MFWGVTIENGKKYSQIVEASYHLSMAALEPTNKNSKDGSKFVSVMLEHMKTEFLLCTLEHNKKLQCKLDLVFQEGEEVTFYLNGEGTVHLTGYLVGALDSEEESDEESGELVPKKSPKKTKAGEEKDSDSEDEEDDDWAPAIINASGKRPLNGISTNSAKKLKSDEKKKNVSPEKKSGNQQLQSKKLKPLLVNQDNSDDDSDEDDSDDDDLDIDDDDDDESGGLQISSDDDDDDDDEDDDDEEESEQWGIKAFPGIQDKKNAGSTPGPGQKKKQLDQSKGQTPQSGKMNQKQKTPQSAKGDQKQKTPQSAKANQKTPQTGKKNQNQTPNQNASAKKGGGDNSFNKTPGGKKQKKQGEEQSPKNQSNKNEGQSPKTPGGGKAKKIQGGVQVEDILEGKGPVAKPGKYVHVYYTGKLPNNKEFDSLTKGKPFGFRLGKSEVIKGWDVALDGMKVGGKRKIVIPPHMGYGNKSQGPIPANSTLHFEVELKAVN